MHLAYPQNPVSIGEHIKKKRIDLKLFQSDVAKIFNVSTDCVTYWENNRVPRRLSSIRKLSNSWATAHYALTKQRCLDESSPTVTDME